MQTSSFNPWPWLPMFLRKLKGPYSFEAFEPVSERSWLLKCSFPDFDLVAYYEISLYRHVYHRWFIPDAGKHMATVYTEAKGNIPEVFKKALSKPFCFPVQAVDGRLTDNHFYEMCMTFNDIMNSRLRDFIKHETQR